MGGNRVPCGGTCGDEGHSSPPADYHMTRRRRIDDGQNSSRRARQAASFYVVTKGRADRSRRPLCYFVGAEVLKGRWASALLGSFTVGQKTGDNFMLV
jgi:hypothetical protein